MKTLTRRLAAIAAGTALTGLVALGDASAATRVSWVGPTPAGAGQSYFTTSTINNAPLEASSRMYTPLGNSVPDGYMGVQARLFKSGVLCQITSYIYNAGAANEMSTNTFGHCGSGSYNSHGFVKYWNGTGYGDFLTFPTDPLNYTAPAARASAPTEEPQAGTNSRGQSLGSGENARTDEQLPDLVAALATNGKQGYVRKSDIVRPDPKNPGEAAARNSAPDRTIGVFAADGTTRIGDLVIR